MKWFDKLTGKKEKVTQTPEDELNELETNRRAALELEKQEATRLGEPWVAVLDTQINPDNIKNGFFELDWNKSLLNNFLMQDIAVKLTNKLLTHGLKLLLYKCLKKKDRRLIEVWVILT